ncbi:ribonuclease P/MRP protein subunit POP5-like [Pomacea canaliculata]|uniref:ribonuclease P/MRP protein subunit POP5-like n=1 Tax=Pomacea canaliculata TaxID=400727 RepID=UPI000D736C8B|nr:ribonuclease P/MRP protein subunit POP5-like [Pomacea canaliculata]XP_025081970.1 ribonuclease P/MRP protein subunit POP5-like [Pomacea canaliculata]XP_025081971.1 ribonuclease P/MRP protein subunit POP5-like [Pomacea canaliculata]
MVRKKNRYLLAEINFADGRKTKRDLKTEVVYRSVRDALQLAFGDYGMGVLKSSLVVKYLNPETSIVIVRAKRDFYRMAQTALSLVKKIDNIDAFFHLLHVGGTIRACQKFLIRHHRRQLPLLFQQCSTQEERKRVQQAVLSTCVQMEMHKAEEKEKTVMEIMEDV